MTGEQLFNLFVDCKLCHDIEYLWSQLSVERQRRWDDMANQINKYYY